MMNNGQGLESGLVPFLQTYRTRVEYRASQSQQSQLIHSKRTKKTDLKIALNLISPVPNRKHMTSGATAAFHCVGTLAR